MTRFARTLVGAACLTALAAGCPPPTAPPADAGPPPGASVHVLKGGDGHGALKSDPELVDCGALCDAQDVVFPAEATTFTLKATPARDALFESWSCDETRSGEALPSQVVATTDVRFTDDDPASLDVTCTASFRQLWTILVVFSGQGSGHVTGSAAGDNGPRIDCPDKCTAGYFDSEQETLTPVPDAGSVFSGWKLDCQGTGPADVTLTRDMNCEAHFCPDTDPGC